MCKDDGLSGKSAKASTRETEKSQGVGGEDWGKQKPNEKRSMETETYKSSRVKKEKEGE